MIVGEYENLAYSDAAKNEYHYVTITYDSLNSVYIWKNKANSNWKLHPTEEEFELRVDKSVSYYKDGWKIAKVKKNGIFGPGNEFYTRVN